jgi:hypothetical protein
MLSGDQSTFDRAEICYSANSGMFEWSRLNFNSRLVSGSVWRGGDPMRLLGNLTADASKRYHQDFQQHEN